MKLSNPLQKRVIEFRYKGHDVQIIADSYRKWRSVYVDGRFHYQSDKRMTDTQAVASIKVVLDNE